MKIGFVWASRFPIIFDSWYIFSHEPIFLEMNSPFANIYGHLHQNKYEDPSGHHYNVCVEQIGYTPKLWTDIKKEINARSKED
jgi:calcineurin-like phosphoesterase family protein